MPFKINFSFRFRLQPYWRPIELEDRSAQTSQSFQHHSLQRWNTLYRYFMFLQKIIFCYFCLCVRFVRHNNFQQFTLESAKVISMTSANFILKQTYTWLIVFCVDYFFHLYSTFVLEFIIFVLHIIFKLVFRIYFDLIKKLTF